MDCLSESGRKQVEVVSSITGFKFGDGRKVFSTERVRIPAKMAGKFCKIEADVTLQFSKSSLKKADEK